VVRWFSVIVYEQRDERGRWHDADRYIGFTEAPSEGEAREALLEQAKRELHARPSETRRLRVGRVIQDARNRKQRAPSSTLAGVAPPRRTSTLKLATKTHGLLRLIERHTRALEENGGGGAVRGGSTFADVLALESESTL